MTSPRKAAGHRESPSLFWSALTLERLMTGSLVHLVYWFGLGIIALGGFGAIGASIGVALREGAVMGWIAAIPVAVAGVLVVLALAILWRSFCEFYVVVMQIGEDLRALRGLKETEGAALGSPSVPRRAPGA